MAKKSSASSRPARRRITRDTVMKRLSSKKYQQELNALAAVEDDEIDTSDIPELTPQQVKMAIRGEFYRPIKRSVTLRLDADVIHWLKRSGPGYQTKTNHLLRTLMLRSLRAKP
jgi:uncharacterized protein (DUF4415 family)